MINHVLSRFDLELRRLPAKTASVIHQDPGQTVYDLICGKPALLSVTLTKCVMINGLSYDPITFHPFTAFLKDFQSGRVTGFNGSVLEDYYNKWIPENAFAAVVPSGQGVGSLASFPSYAFTLPWWSELPPDIASQRRKSSSRQNSTCKPGRRTVDIAGSQFHGPVANCKGTTECARLVRVWRSLKRNGYDVAAHIPMLGELLVHKGDARIMVYEGNHRIAALVALGYDRAGFKLKHPVRISSDDVQSWPGVRSGIWGADEAYGFFEGLFSARLNQYVQRLMQG